MTPGASREKVGGAWRDPQGPLRLVVKVTAPPEKGRANEAAAAALAGAFVVAKSAVRRVAGETDRRKTFEVKGDMNALEARLAALLSKG